MPQGRFAQVTAEWAEAPGPKNAILSLKDYAALSLGTDETGWSFEADWWRDRFHEHCGEGCETQEACGAPNGAAPA